MLCFFLVVQVVCKKIVSSDALELHTLIREAKQHNELFIQCVSKGQKIEPKIEVKKGQKNTFSLEFLAFSSEKSLFFSSSFFEGSSTIFISLSLRQMQTHKINFPTNEAPHHNEQTTTTRKTREMMAKTTTTPLSPRGRRRRRRLFFHTNFHFLLLLSSSLLLFSTTPMMMCLAFSSSSASSHRFHPSEDELSRVRSAKFISCPG